MFEREGIETSRGALHQPFLGSVAAWQPVQSRIMQRLQVEEKPPETHTHAKVSRYHRVKRILDCMIAAALMLVLAPVLVTVAFILWARGTSPVLQRTLKVGRDCRTFFEYAFNTKQRLVRSLPILFNIVIGDLSFIGPRAALVGEMCACCRTNDAIRHCRNAIRPGLMCDWWVRRRASLDYVDEIALDVAYVQRCSFRKDLSIVVRGLPGLITALIWGDDPPEYAPSVRILDVRIDNISMKSAIDRLVEMLDGPGAKHACFINPHYVNVSLAKPEYKASLEEAALVLPDGFGTKLAGKILNRPIRQNLCGTDLFPRLCSRLSGSGKGIYLLGGAPGVAERVAGWISEHYPAVAVKGWDHGYFTAEEEPDVVQRIAASGADCLIVAMGVPKQEIWIHTHLPMLNVKIAMGFGGLFDYFAGRIPRAPQWVREMGMEWVYRLIQEPRRMWRRYLVGNAVFLAHVIRERVRPRV